MDGILSCITHLNVETEQGQSVYHVYLNCIIFLFLHRDVAGSTSTGGATDVGKNTER